MGPPTASDSGRQKRRIRATNWIGFGRNILSFLHTVHTPSASLRAAVRDCVVRVPVGAWVIPRRGSGRMDSVDRVNAVDIDGGKHKYWYVCRCIVSKSGRIPQLHAWCVGCIPACSAAPAGARSGLGRVGVWLVAAGWLGGRQGLCVFIKAPGRLRGLYGMITLAISFVVMKILRGAGVR
jgi:hypothetical protein